MSLQEFGYQEQLRRILTRELGVAWGPDRNGTREMVGFEPAQWILPEPKAPADGVPVEVAAGHGEPLAESVTT